MVPHRRLTASVLALLWRHQLAAPQVVQADEAPHLTEDDIWGDPESGALDNVVPRETDDDNGAGPGCADAAGPEYVACVRASFRNRARMGDDDGDEYAEGDDDGDEDVDGPPLSERRPLPGPAPIPSAGCGTPLRWPTGTPSRITLPIDDPLLYDPYREFFVYLPKGYNNTLPLPVVYGFHGYYNSAENKMAEDDFMWKIEKDLKKKHQRGFILVYGQGMADCGKEHCYVEPWPERTWNVWGLTESPGPRGPTCFPNRYRFGRYGCATSCRLRAGHPLDPSGNASCFSHDHCHAATCANDTLYADLMMKAVESRLCVDRRRLYVTGMSTGGMMAYHMAVHFSDRFAAAVPVAGSALVGFWQDPKMAIPLMDIHGTLDTTVPANYSNGFIAKGKHAKKTPMRVPGCSECAFADDGFYYTPNYNITRGIAMSNKCSCTRYKAACVAKHWPTVEDSTALGRKAKWTCFDSFGDCGAHPVVRCTWEGGHEVPARGKFGGASPKAKHQFFSNIAWEFLSKFYIPVGSEKERQLLQKPYDDEYIV